MDKEAIKRIAGNPDFILGIYNYCDRWCQRCTFTSRCMSFEIDKETIEKQETRDFNNEQFWQKLTEILQVTLEMLGEMAEKEGIDLNNILETDPAITRHRLNRETARDHELARAAQAYAEKTEECFDSLERLFDDKADEWNLKAILGFPYIDPIEEAARLKDALEVIRWYQHFIYPKLMRALEGDLRGTPKILEGCSKDSDGSAKIALISIDRSISAWGEMLQHFSEREEEIFDMLVHLERLRRKTEEVFPHARAFIRPGFDIMNKNG